MGPLSCSHLKLLEMVEFFLESEELIERARLHNPAALHDDDPVSAANRGQPMRHDERRAPANKLLHRLLHMELRGIIKRRCRLIQQDHLRVANERAGDSDSLPLSAATACPHARRPMYPRRSAGGSPFPTNAPAPLPASAAPP